MNPNQNVLKSIVLCLFLSLTLFTCDKDDSPSNSNNNNQDPDPTAFTQNFGNEVSRNFLGTVKDKNNSPIENVSISIGNSSVLTDSNGIFIINSANVHERFAYVKAEKEGYIHGSRAVVPSNGTNKISITLLEETIIGTTSSGTSETINLGNGASVALPGDYKKADGSTYSGSVDVIMHHLDPADENMSDQMPGMLYAANAQNEERMLQTYGMLAVELRGSGGEDLNLAEGSTAEIILPLDPSLMASAPSTIPLWYFDEANGYWIEDGVATLVGSTYVGTVSHFSFWNCDIPAEAVNLCVTVSDEAGNLLSNMYAAITSTNYGTAGGSTNENGEVCGLVPSGETLELNIYNYDICGEASLYSASIGPFTSDSNISITVLDNPDIISESVVGSFNTCNGDPVTDGYVTLNYGGQTHFESVTDGSFEINLLRCNTLDTFSIVASDYANLQSTDSISYTFTTPITDIGTLTSCNSITEFIQYTIDGNESELLFEYIEAYFYPSGDNPSATNLLNIYSQGNNNCFYLEGHLTDAPHEGSYDNLDWGNTDDIGISIVECLGISETNNNIISNLTSLGEVGEYIDINFSGDYEGFDGTPHTISGVIHVIRDN